MNIDKDGSTGASPSLYEDENKNILQLGLTPVDPSLSMFIAIYAQYMTLAINVDGVFDGLRPTIRSKSAISAKTQNWVLSTAN